MNCKEYLVILITWNIIWDFIFCCYCLGAGDSRPHTLNYDEWILSCMCSSFLLALFIWLTFQFLLCCLGRLWTLVSSDSSALATQMATTPSSIIFFILSSLPFLHSFLPFLLLGGGLKNIFYWSFVLRQHLPVAPDGLNSLYKPNWLQSHKDPPASGVKGVLYQTGFLLKLLFYYFCVCMMHACEGHSTCV